MPIYTRTGDGGETGLIGARRVRKDDPRIRAYGAVDELNAFLGLARSESLPAEVQAELAAAQGVLFEIGADLATIGGRASVECVRSATSALEKSIDRCERELTPLRNFVLPGGDRGAASLHVARTVCRRAEREVWALAAATEVPEEIGSYLNRLSDALFVWARLANHRAGVSEPVWKRGGD